MPLDGLLDPGYLSARRSSIVADQLGPDPGPGAPSAPAAAGEPLAGASLPDDGNTTHFVVLDRWGNLVCCTATIEAWFGTGITVPGYGFLLNNQLTDFDPRPGGANQVRPLARPASSMVPTLVLRDGNPWLALGSPGGPTIVTAVLQTLLHVVDDGMTLEDAVAAPRVFARGYPGLTWEAHLPAETLAGLAALGHQPSRRPRPIGAVQAIQLDPPTGHPLPVADPRRLGAALQLNRARGTSGAQHRPRP
jgi:gamma-glutamyltranspeptidase/glutathione hydrolase